MRARRTAPRRRSPAGEASSPTRRRRVSREEVENFVAQPSVLDRLLGRLRGRTARSPTRCASSASGRALRAYAAERGVRLIGDLPIYVAPDGADVAGWPELFQDGAVGGVPPDDWSATGQLWGNPLYDWTTLRRTGYRWWIERFRRTFELVDMTRVDHFRGFVAYWADSRPLPDGAPRRLAPRPRSARSSTRRRAELGELPLIAENLGVITPAVERLREELGLPGMLILQFALACGRGDPRRPGRGERNRVVFTGTHDNDTTARLVGDGGPLGGRTSAPRRRRPASTDEEPNWILIRLALASPAQPRDRAGAGRARARQRGAHEHAGRGRPATGSGGSSRGS